MRGEAEAVSDETARAVERSLTVAGRGHEAGGRFNDKTSRRYAAYWRDAHGWLTSLGRSTVTPWSSETLAHYAGVLLEQGYATRTVDGRLAAVKAEHRKRGWPVPDGVAAWFVLRGANLTADEGVKVNTPRSRRASLADAVRHLEASGTSEARDLCWVTLGWDLMARIVDLVAMNIADVQETAQGEGLRVRIGGRWMLVEHLHEPVEVCPVEATLSWLTVLHEHGATSGALFRPVDKGGNIGGTADPWAGPGSPERLSEGGLQWAWNRLVSQGQLGASTARDLRLASAMEAAEAGVAIPWILDRGGWKLNSSRVLPKLFAAAAAGQAARDARPDDEGDDDDD